VAVPLTANAAPSSISAGGGRGGTQSQDAGYDLSNVSVGRHQAFGVQFA